MYAPRRCFIRLFTLFELCVWTVTVTPWSRGALQGLQLYRTLLSHPLRLPAELRTQLFTPPPPPTHGVGGGAQILFNFDFLNYLDLLGLKN